MREKFCSKFNQKSREVKYIIADPYILFHHKWVKDLSKNDVASFSKGHWRNEVSKQTFSIWSGYAFEMVIMTNIKLYLKARGLEGVFSGVYHCHESPLFLPIATTILETAESLIPKNLVISTCL